MQKNKTAEHDQGIALISVLWALMVLSILVMSVMTVAKVQSHYADNIGRKSKAVAIADAGIYLAVQRLSAPGAARRLPEKISSFTVQFVDKEINMTIIPETGKIDLNTSHEMLIGAVLAYNGMDENSANAIAEKLRILRDASPEKPFKVISDIRQFEGIDRQIYQCIEPYLTVYSNRLGVNYAAAFNDMETLIKWADKIRFGGQNWLEISGAATGSLVSGTQSVLQQTGSHAGKAFTIRAEVAVSDDVKIQRRAVIRITGNRREPFWVYRWATTYQRDLDICKTVDGK